MPVQWHGTINSPQQLASVIQGEAGKPAGQFAVASVMWNRMQASGVSGVGFGSNDITQVVTPSQFNGYNASPSPYAQQIANDLWNGQAPSGGSTGNALFFAAPSSGNAAWANPATESGQGLFSNGANIGGNYFTDKLGPPSTDFVAPQYGGASVGSDKMTLSIAPAGPYDGSIQPSTNGVGPFDVNGPNYGSAGGGAPVSADNPGSIAGAPGFSTVSVGSGGASGAQPGGASGAQPGGASGAQPGGASGAQPGGNSGPGLPVVITDITGAGQVGAAALAKQVDASTNSLTGTITKTEQAAAATGTGWLSSFEKSGTDWLVRLGLFLLAMVLLLGAWQFYGTDARQGAAA